VIAAPQPGQRLSLSCVPWSAYELVSRAFEDRHIRITYDRGDLEFMILTHEHESSKKVLGRLIDMLTFVLHIRIHSGGSTTLSREALEKAIEPDECYWIQNEPLMRSRSDYDIETDPPPDLGVEVEITASSINRMDIYAALRVPEVWRVKRGSLSVHHLGANGQYKEKNRSRAFPFLPLDEVRRFLNESQTTDETTLLHAFHDWVRDNLLPKHTAAVHKPAKGDKRNGKRNGKKS
jgi:Uma2 family endonuclease